MSGPGAQRTRIQRRTGAPPIDISRRSPLSGGGSAARTLRPIYFPYAETAAEKEYLLPASSYGYITPGKCDGSSNLINGLTLWYSSRVKDTHTCHVVEGSSVISSNCKQLNLELTADIPRPTQPLIRSGGIGNIWAKRRKPCSGINHAVVCLQPGPLLRRLRYGSALAFCPQPRPMRI